MCRALGRPPVILLDGGKVRLGVLQVGDDGLVHRVDRRAGSLRVRRRRRLQAQRDGPEHLDQIEVVQGPQEAGFAHAPGLEGGVHLHDCGLADRRVGRIDRPVEVDPCVPEELRVGIQLRRIVVDILEAAVGALGEDVGTKLRDREPAFLRVEAAQRRVRRVDELLEDRLRPVGPGRQAGDHVLVQVHAGWHAGEQRGTEHDDVFAHGFLLARCPA